MPIKEGYDLQKADRMLAQSPGILCCSNAQPDAQLRLYLQSQIPHLPPPTWQKTFPNGTCHNLWKELHLLRNTALTVVMSKPCQVSTCHGYQSCLVIYNTKSGQHNTDSYGLLLWSQHCILIHITD